MEALARAWELTCNSGVYTGDEIHEIETKLLHTLFYQQNQYWRRSGPRESLGTRHQAAGSFAFLVLTEALRRHCPDGTDVAERLDRWIGEVKSYFRSFAERRSYHGERDSNSAFQVTGILLDYALREGELEIFKNGTARQGIRKAVAAIDNLGYGAGLQNYEDTYPGHVRAAYLVGEPLALAAFYCRDPYMKWLTRNWPGCEFKTWFAHGYGRQHAYATGDSLVARPPEGPHFCGFVPAAALGDRLKRNVEAGRASVPYARAFDKLCLRGGFDPQATYLVVQGMEPLTDWRDDANCIIRMTERGRICLFHNNKWPSRFHKNGVLVSPGFSAPPPRAARLDLVANFDSAAFSQTTLPEYRGTDWIRRIAWLQGRFTLVLDDVMVHKPDEYSATCVWRTPVEASLRGRRWASRERGIDFHVVSDALLPATAVPEPMVGWEVGLRGSGLRQIQHAQAQEGHVIRFRNLLYTSHADEAKTLDVRRLSEGASVVSSNSSREKWLAGFDGFTRRDIKTDAAMFVVGATRAFLAQATFLRVGGKTAWQTPERADAAVPLQNSAVPKMLSALWSKASNPRTRSQPRGPAQGPLRVAWMFDGFARPSKPIPGVSVSSNTARPKGLEFIANGEFVRDRAQFAHFDSAPDLVIDLHDAHRITGFRIWTRPKMASEGSAAPDKPIQAQIAISNQPEFASADERTVSLRPGFRFCELYKTQVYVFHFYEADGLDSTARYMRLKLPDTVRQIAELEVFGDETTAPELLEVCTANLDSREPHELVVTTRVGEVVALTLKGKQLWSKRLPGEPLALAAGDLDGTGADEAVVSALDGGLHWFDASGTDHRILPWPQRFGRLQYDLAFGVAAKNKPQPLFASSYYDVALVRHGAKPQSSYVLGMWDYDLLPPTHDLDGKGGPDFLIHDIYGYTRSIDTAGLQPRHAWRSVRGRLSHWQLVDLPGQKQPALLVIGWDGLGMYRTEPRAKPRELWRREDGVRIFCGLVTEAGDKGRRILAGKADGFIAEFGLDGKPLDCHWVGWPVKALAQIRDPQRQSYVLVGTDGGLLCFDESWQLRQSLPGACVKLLPVKSNGKASAVALFLDGKVERLDLAGGPRN